MEQKLKWLYVKPVTDKNNIENIELKYNIKIPDYLKEIIIEHNGGRPLKNIFNTNKSKERVFKNLLSYNKEDKDNIYMYDNLFYKGYIPFALTPSGDLICINFEKLSVELYLHESDTFEWICNDIKEFINSLYLI